MAEIDPVILQLKAELGKYVSDLRSTTATVDKLLGAQEKRAKSLEKQMAQSSGAIKNQLRGLGAALAGAFTGRELVGLLDSFTRLQNNLKVAGLEGDKLKAVQDRLFASAQKYGVELEGLSGLFGKAILSQRELGASQEQILRVTDLTAAALKITGVSAAQSAGAVLGLTQSFASGRVKAEEFNQIVEGGLQPLLQAAANSERFGGSIAKLRQAVVDGKVSSQEFFNAILAGAGTMEGQAAKAALTLSAGFTTLSNALTVYFGEADKANGVSAALGEAMGALAKNLDTVIPALSVIAVAAFGRFAAGALVGGASLRALSAYASIATTSLAGTALAARGAGAALLSAFGGPVGLAITAVVLGLGYAATESAHAASASKEYAQNQETLRKVQESAANATDNLASATGRARSEAVATTVAVRTLTNVYYEMAKAALVAARAQVAERKAKAPSAAPSGSFQGVVGRATRGLKNLILPGNTAQDEQNVVTQEATVKGFEQELARLDKMIAGGQSSRSGAASDTKKKKGAGAGASGPSAKEIERRFNDELISLTQQTISAQASVATSAEEQAELALRNVEWSRRSAIAGIAADKDYNAGQKKILSAQVEELAFHERARIDFEKKARLEQEAAALSGERYRVDSEALQGQYELADSQAERKRIALEMIDLEERYQRSLLDAILASEAATDAEKKRAQVAIDGLNAASADRREQAKRGNETPAERYLRELRKSKDSVNESIDQIKIDGLNALNDGLVDAIMGAKSLGEVFKNVANQIVADLLRIAIQRALIEPLADALFGGGSSGGGGSSSGIGGGLLGLGNSLLGQVFGMSGRASGGPVRGGQMYRVNEGASPGRVEGFIPQGSGTIIPLGRMNVAQGGAQGGGVTTVRLELSGDIDARIDQRSSTVAVQVVRASAPSLIDASARETMARAGRPRL
ncbi:tape measure protein [Novosphingobium sp.]|uniref:tape measure protein n=1 Tax=Novosphingobium sp. TaxID=1874826 RepID=UPI00286DC5A4|nr:tape measure protein [Novosphingobium sp.]